MGQRKLEFQISAKVFDDLMEIQTKLPARATGGLTGDGAEETATKATSYDHPAGMALLGEKDGCLDTVIPLRMSGGCWDAPNINYKDMDVGFRALIEKDRICSGMALVRHPTWRTSAPENERGVMPNHLKYQLQTMRKSFADITKTAWIVLHQSYFRVYRPTAGKDGRIGCREVAIDKLFSPEDKKIGIVAKRIKEDAATRKAKALALVAAHKAKIERNRAILAARKAEEERVAKEAEAAKKLAEKQKKKIDILNKKLKAGEEDIIDAGGGYVYMKQKNGEYILWETGRKK